MTIVRVVLDTFDYHDCNSRMPYWSKATSSVVEDSKEVREYVNELNVGAIKKNIASNKKLLNDLLESIKEAKKKNELIANMSSDEIELLSLKPVRPFFFSSTESEIKGVEDIIKKLEALLEKKELDSSDMKIVGVYFYVEAIEVTSFEDLKKGFGDYYD